MSQALIITGSIIFIILVLFYEVIFLVYVIVGIKNKVPFIPTPKPVLKEISKAMNLSKNGIVYDLGCGNGQILFYLSKNNPNIKYIGIENNPYPLILARLRLFFSGKEKNKNIKIINNNFFKQDLREATHVFTYLSSDLMDKLLPKFEKELSPGTRLVSLSFYFENKKPIEKIDLKRGKNKLGRELYIYQF